MNDGSDGDEDAQLRGMRAVWLSMPDEEPPTGGMAELLAAARAKADAMANAPAPRTRWWIVVAIVAAIGAVVALAARFG